MMRAGSCLSIYTVASHTKSRECAGKNGFLVLLQYEGEAWNKYTHATSSFYPKFHSINIISKPIIFNSIRKNSIPSEICPIGLNPRSRTAPRLFTQVVRASPLDTLRVAGDRQRLTTSPPLSPSRSIDQFLPLESHYSPPCDSTLPPSSSPRWGGSPPPPHTPSSSRLTHESASTRTCTRMI